MAVAMDSSRVMNGTYGQAFDANGRWMTNIKTVEATVEIEKEDVPRAGTRWKGSKVIGLKGTGSIAGYRLTTELIENIGRVANDRQAPYVTELRFKVDDPEAYGAFSVRLKNVQFDSIPLAKFEVGSLVEDELAFTFSEYEFIDTIAEV